MKRVLYHSSLVNDSEAIPGADPDRKPVEDLAAANLISSQIHSDEPITDWTGDWHAPVLDLDGPKPEAVKECVADWYNRVPGILLRPDRDFEVHPSSTSGHHHLYVNAGIVWEDYVVLLEYLGGLGVLEPGYVSASLARKATFVRKPGLLKEVAA